MENQALLSLPGVWRGHTGLLSQPVSSLQPDCPREHPAVLRGEAAMAGEANALYQPIKPTDMQPEVAVVKVARLPPWQPFHPAASLPSAKTSAEPAPHTRTSGGGCTSKGLPQKEAVQMDQASSGHEEQANAFSSL